MPYEGSIGKSKNNLLKEIDQKSKNSILSKQSSKTHSIFFLSRVKRIRMNF